MGQKVWTMQWKLGFQRGIRGIIANIVVLDALHVYGARYLELTST